MRLRFVRELSPARFAEVGKPADAWKRAGAKVVALASEIDRLYWPGRAVYEGQRIRYRLSLYDGALERRLGVFDRARFPINDVAFHPTRPLVAIGTGSYDGGYMFEGDLWLWDWESGEVRTLLGECRDVAACRWVDEDRLAVLLHPRDEEEYPGEEDFETYVGLVIDDLRDVHESGFCSTDSNTDPRLADLQPIDPATLGFAASPMHCRERRRRFDEVMGATSYEERSRVWDLMWLSPELVAAAHDQCHVEVWNARTAERIQHVQGEGYGVQLLQALGSPLVHGHRVFLSGVVPLDGNVPSNGNLRIDPEMFPAVLVGRPGGSAVLEGSLGKLAVFAPDFYLGNLEYRHRADYVRDEGDPVHLFVVGSSASRFTVHDVAFTRMQGVPVNTGLGNSSVMMFVRGADRRHVAVVHCDVSGPSGVFTSAYSLRYAVFELNRWHEAELSLADGSAPAIIYIKGDDESVTIRANDIFENNTWSGLSGVGINEARLIEVSHNRVRTPYDSGRAGSVRLFTNSPASGFAWTSDTPVWIDRNSVRQRIVWEGEALADMPEGTVRIERNIVDSFPIPTSARIASTENAASEGLLDDRLEVAAPSRAEHLGRRGATIAVPIE